MNEVLHVHIMAWITASCLFHSPTAMIFQCTVFLPSLWWLCTCLPVIIWGVVRALFLNILPQNHWQPRWKLLGGTSVSIVLGSCLIWSIHKVPGVGQGHHLRFVLLVGVYKSAWLPVQRFTHCAHFTWYCIYLWVIVGSWISISFFILIYPCECSGKNPWFQCTCIAIWCWRLRCLHAFSLWLSLMWVWWLLLDSLWDFLPQRVLFCEFLFLWYDVTSCSIICCSFVFWFISVKDELYCVNSCVFFPYLV